MIALLLALVLAAPAHADEPKGQAIVGGGSFGSAPVIDSGRYRDTILPMEYLYYAIPLSHGQSLRVTANADMELEDFLDRAMSVQVILLSPTGPEAEPFMGGDWNPSFRVNGEPPADQTWPEPSTERDDDTWGAWEGPGVYYLSFYALYGSDNPPRQEIPFHFTVEIDGPPAPTPTPSPSPSPKPRATATPRPPAPAGPAPEVAALVGLGGLLLGVFAGLASQIRTKG